MNGGDSFATTVLHLGAVGSTTITASSTGWASGSVVANVRSVTLVVTVVSPSVSSFRNRDSSSFRRGSQRRLTRRHPDRFRVAEVLDRPALSRDVVAGHRSNARPDRV